MEATNLRTRTILVVDDNTAIRDAMTILLEGEGYAVASAANGEEALRRLRTSTPPRLILLDLSMPVMDGWQFRRAQQQDPALAPIPIVVVSAEDNGPQRAAAMQAACYLQKPVDVDDLLAIVRRHF